MAMLMQVIGFSARLALRTNPFSQPLFLLQFTALSIGPTLLLVAFRLATARLFLFQHHANTPSPLFRRLSFIAFPVLDYVSLILQCAGAGIGASAIEGSRLQAQGIDVLLAGLGLQVVGVVLFGALVAESARRQGRGRDRVFEVCRVGRWWRLRSILTETSAPSSTLASPSPSPSPSTSISTSMSKRTSIVPALRVCPPPSPPPPPPFDPRPGLLTHIEHPR